MKLEKYQEQSQLLDPHLESMITPLSGLLMKSALEPSSNSISVVQHVSKLLWSIASVRGYKVVVKFFPNEAANLEPVVRQDTQRREESNSIWEAQCTLTLWLAQLVLIPFDLASVDSSISASATSSGSWPPIVSKIMNMYKGHMSSPGSIRDMAALLLGRLLTRPDLQPALDNFLQWSRMALHSEGSQAHFLIPGVTYALAAIFSTGQRKQLLPFASQIWTDAAQLLNSRTAASSVVARKFATKLVQRIGLTFLPATVAAWRYQQNSVSINESLSNSVAAAAEEAGDDDLDIPEEIEQVIEVLLTSLQDKDTVVRWSAAKGLGRITSRLPQELGDDVVVSVIELFSPSESDTAWHGGCLALAELARRGLLLPSRLRVVAPLVAEALQYDVRRGPHSVGAHVRDAAAYVCWAFARAYTAADMLESIAVLAPALLVTACYDREVNCRRAASAAYQESVGRQGNVPHGIDILTAADYFTLSSRTQAYLTVAPFIAQFPEYKQALADHLLSTKLSHWERSLRELTSKALAALVPTQPGFLQTTAVDTLLPLCLNSILEVRHGAALGVGELTLALHSQGQALDTDRQYGVAGVVPAIEKARLYRGKGGELMRGAVCRLEECLALAKLPLTPAQHKQLHSSIDENLRHPTASIQSAACSALAAFTATYMPTGDAEAINKTSDKYLGLLTDPNVAVRRGAAAALGALPTRLLEPLSRQILAGLAAATQVEEDPDDRDAETRVAAVKALALVAHKLYGPRLEAAACDARQAATTAAAADPAAAALSTEHVVKALLAAVEDYSTDNRGDIGSWVREAAVMEMPQCLVLLCTLDPEHVKVDCEEQASITQMVIQALLKQSVERIARLREVS
ncbi:MAG: tubulin-specific chaperone D-like, partial [Trebouxia sp. A1-2]